VALARPATYLSSMETTDRHAPGAPRHEPWADPWGQLEQELDAWDAARPATFWWRDDDAVAGGARLDRLLALSAEMGAPLALAVIPARLDVSLGAALAASAAEVCVLQHGFAHLNHAPRGQGLGAWELGLHRGEAAVLGDLITGREILAGSLERFLPVITPPWNRIDPALFPRLPSLGYRGVTAFGPRESSEPARGLRLNHAHCDPINWKKGGVFAGEAKVLGQILEHLTARRAGEADADEATGLLTHHIDMDQGAWGFCGRLLKMLTAHPVARIAAAPELFP
jgi:hypothetical protein